MCLKTRLGDNIVHISVEKQQRLVVSGVNCRSQLLSRFPLAKRNKTFTGASYECLFRIQNDHPVEVIGKVKVGTAGNTS